MSDVNETALLQVLGQHIQPGGTTGIVLVRGVTDMQANMEVRVAHEQFAVPAQEQTKQEIARQQGQTRRHIISDLPRWLALVAFLGLFAYWLVVKGEISLPLLGAVALILGGPASLGLAREILKKFGLVT